MPSRDLVEKVARKLAYADISESALPRVNLAPYRKLSHNVLSVVADELKNVTLEMVRVGVDYRLGTVIDGENNWKTDTCALFCRMLSVSPLMKDEAK